MCMYDVIYAILALLLLLVYGYVRIELVCSICISLVICIVYRIINCYY